MTHLKGNPVVGGTTSRGNSKVSVALYNPSQKSAQARIARRYHISLPHAVAIAGLLNLGGANNG